MSASFPDWRPAASTTGLLGAACGIGFLAAVAPYAAVALLAVAATIYWSSRQEPWRRVLAATVLVFAAASFNNDPLAGGVFYGRYAVAGVLVLLLWGQRRVLYLRECPPQVRWLVTAGWLLALLSAASIAWSVSPSTTGQQALAFALVVAAVHGCVTRRWVERGRIVGDISVIFQVLVVTFVAGVAARYATLGFDAVSTYSHRFYGVYSNPNTLGILSALVVPMGLGLWSYTKRRGYLLGVAVAFYSILLCESRTALLAVAAAAAVVVLRRGTSAVMTALAVLGAGIVIVGLSSSLTALPGPLQGVADRLGGGGPGGELTNRGAAWSKALSLWRHRPWSGYGFRTGDVVFANDPTGTFTRGMAHNSYIQIILELGVIGAVLAALLVALLVCVVRQCPVVGLGGGLIGTVVAGLCAGLTESALWGSGAAFCWAFWLSGAAASCWSSAKSPPGDDDFARESSASSAAELPPADRKGTRVSVRLSA